MNKAIIYTDGSCLGNPGPGGFAVIWKLDDGTEQELSSGSYRTTNNRMELTAVVTGLSALKGASFDVTVYTDSKYIVNAFEQHWIDGWIKRGWKLSDGKPVKNMDLWMVLLSEMKKHNVTFQWVKGHNGDPYNERCDELARGEAEKIKAEIEANNAVVEDTSATDVEFTEVDDVRA